MLLFTEDDLLPISALAHLLFCERRAVLVHLEEIWEDNPFTAEGRHIHEKAHGTGTAVEGKIRVARGLWLRSLYLGLIGKADVTEFHPCSEAENAPPGVPLPGVEGLWRPFPVEYKRGRRRHERGYEIQLCAQAMCMEEMLSVSIPQGALYYAATHRRLEIDFDETLRKETKTAAARLHELMNKTTTPLAQFGKKCESCSMLNLCLPQNTGKKTCVLQYLLRQIEQVKEAE